MQDFIKKYKSVLIGALILVLGAVAGVTTTVIVSPGETKTETKVEAKSEATVEFSETQLEEEVEVKEGEETKVIEVPTVEEVDGGKVPTDKDGKTAKELDLGKGAIYNATSPKTWLDSTYGACIDMDGRWGSQCVDYFNAYNYQEYGYWLDTCGTGAARGLWDCRNKNAKDKYDLITDVNQLLPGD